MRHASIQMSPDGQGTGGSLGSSNSGSSAASHGPVAGGTPTPSIRPMSQSLGGSGLGTTPKPVAPQGAASREVAPEPPPPKIHAFEQKMGVKKHEDQWTRSPNLTGQGAIHCKSFHCKLSDDSLTYMDQQINEWLDAHPQYEVKFVTTAVGEWTGKIREPQMVVQLWM